MKQFRVVYEYKKGLMRGAGAAFVIARDEADAREQLGQAMPGVVIVQLKEEPEDPLAVYERRPRHATTSQSAYARAESGFADRSSE